MDSEQYNDMAGDEFVEGQAPDEEPIDQHIMFNNYSGVNVQETVADLQKNYKGIEKEIEERTMAERDLQHTRYAKVIELIQSLKQSLKTEIHNRKETEDAFM